jgi:transporter family protein
MFRALASPGGDVSRVSPIDKLSMPLSILLAVLFLHERPSAVNWAGIALMVVGAYLVAHKG